MIRPNIIGTYKNGNTLVQLYADGTRLRYTDENEFRPEFPDSLDIKLTAKCDMGCPFCYESCTTGGEHSVLFEDGHPAQKWLEDLRPFTEVALNVNDMTHPQLEELLVYLRLKQVVANITIHQKHFTRSDIFSSLVGLYRRGLFRGIGISLCDAFDENFLEKLKYFKDTLVVHVVAGIVTTRDLLKLYNRDIRLLILGYKLKGRGVSYFSSQGSEVSSRINDLKENLRVLLDFFKVVSFDNLALEQLDVKEILFKDRPEEWDVFYSGADGSHTFYIDAVNETFSRDSTVSDPERIYSSEDLTILEMFKFIQNENGRNQ